MDFVKKIILTLSMVLICGSAFAAETNKPVKQIDVRLLIDISGSMKNNDPKKLRIPALQLVANLMPKGAKSGVWTFGRYVNMIVPLAKVDAQWQNKATQSAKKINSAGMFTNIGDALLKASYGWNKVNVNEKRSLILLTDGMVDISKDQSVNEKERDKIITEILPKLVKSKVSVHTIALSKNTDHALLKEISTQTDGYYQSVDSADELQKVFLKLFEMSAARDNLPITDNQFNVDTSIDEMTLLVFKTSKQNETALITPDKSRLAQSSSGIRWFSSDKYDLITIQSPQAGTWQIDAEVDPDNRVMIISKLGLSISPIPNNLLAGEAINYQMSLIEDNKLITKNDFLNLVDAKLIQKKQGKTSRLAMFYDNVSFQFKQSFFTDDIHGVLNLSLSVKSPTFERVRNHTINIYGSPLIHEIKLSEQNEQPHQLIFKVREDIVQADSLKVTATVTYPNLEKQHLIVDDLLKPVNIRVFPEGGEYSVGLDIKGLSILGREFSVSPTAFIFNTEPTEKYLAEQNKKEPPVSTEKDDVETKENVAEIKEPPLETKVDKDKKEDDEISWGKWLYLGLGLNFILVLLGFFTWKLIKKKNHQKALSMADELAADEEEKE